VRVLWLIPACLAALSAAQNPAVARRDKAAGVSPAAAAPRANRPAAQEPRRDPIVKRLHAQVAMRDGVKLSTNIFLPSDHGRFPTILERTPYNKGADITPLYQFFVENGYAVVAQDVRGRYESEGVFQPLRQEPGDGDDTLNWIARQPWSDGKAGMIGGSYRGIVQWKVAPLNNPHLKAMFPVVSGWDDYRDRFYSTGGAMKLGNRLEWMSENFKTPNFAPDFRKFVFHLPLRTADVAATGRTTEMYQDAVDHPAFDAFWRAISIREQIQKVRAPVFAVGGWYDNYGQSDLEAFAALRKTNGLNHLTIGPWPHSMSYKFTGVDYGPDSQIPIREMQLAWFDQWLKGRETPLASQAPLRIFVMGSNRWRDEREWPPAGARPYTLYLKSGGKANSVTGDGSLAAKPARTSAQDRFVFDPYDPVPTRGGAVCCNPTVFPWGPMDQRPVEQRKDVLVYSTKPLKRDLEVVGPVTVTLYASTSGRDTDFTAKLVDVLPNGYARNLTDGVLRLRYRDSVERAEPAAPGEVYKLTIDAGVTANAFLKGHRIRLEISSSNFPRFDRNSNTGGRISEETRLFKANQTIYHDAAHPSQLTLLLAPAREQAALSTRAPRRAATPNALRPK
jgi:uncharacterized protein